MTDPFRRPTFGSAVFYDDPFAALDWLEAAFGFERTMVITDAEGWASFATTDFWRNLPGPGITALTFFVCGFAIVYLLGARSFCFRGSLGDLTTAVAMSRCDDKALTRRLLERAGLSVPDQAIAKDATAVRRFLEKHGRIVVKPARGEQGRGISVGLSDMATGAFVSEVQNVLPEGEPAASITNGIFVTTPLLFDTATEVAQNFRTDHIAEYGVAPDWTAAFSYDAANLAVAGIIADIGQAPSDDEQETAADVEVLRGAIRDYLNGFDHPERAKRVVGGVTVRF